MWAESAGGSPRSAAFVLVSALLLCACQSSASRPRDAGVPTPPTDAARAVGSSVRPVLDTGAVRAGAHRTFPVAFPVRPSANGRFLEDQRGVPFLVKGEAAWLALANLTEDEQETYLADRAAKGFNLVEVMLTNHDYTHPPNPVPPANRRGEQPFLRPGDLSRPNEAYFDRAVAFVDRAAARGIAVLLAPSYLGFDGGEEGWWAVLNAPENTREVCAGFGTYLGKRFRDRRNLIWLAGGDFAPPPGSEGEARHAALVEAIRAEATQPWTGHWNVGHQGGISTDQKRFEALMELNGVYQYADTYRFAARAYDVHPPRPVYLLESTYEHEHPDSNTQPFRKAWWWTMVSGGAGVIWGNHFLWMCESARASYQATYGDTDHVVSSWKAELESPGTHQILQLHRFFEALPWQRLVPAEAGPGAPGRITGGQRWGQGHIAVASTPEGDLVVAYVPPTGSEHRRFELDLSALPAPAQVRWFDPVAGTTRDGAALPAHPGEVQFEVPGNNAGGADDWALLIEARSP